MKIFAQLELKLWRELNILTNYYFFSCRKPINTQAIVLREHSDINLRTEVLDYQLMLIEIMFGWELGLK